MTLSSNRLFARTIMLILLCRVGFGDVAVSDMIAVNGLTNSFLTQHWDAPDLPTPSTDPVISTSFDFLAAAPFDPALGTLQSVNSYGFFFVDVAVSTDYRSLIDGYIEDFPAFEVNVSASSGGNTSIGAVIYCVPGMVTVGLEFSCSRSEVGGFSTGSSGVIDYYVTLSNLGIAIYGAEAIGFDLTVNTSVDIYNEYTYTAASTPVPVPASMMLLMSGLTGLGLLARRSQRRPRHQ